MKIKLKPPEQRVDPGLPQAPSPKNVIHDWRSWCSALIDGACTSRFAYARAYMARSPYAADPGVVAFFRQGLRQQGQPTTLPEWHQAADDLFGNRKNLPRPMAKLGLALAWGEELHRRLFKLYPGHKNALTLSRDALGENLSRIDRKRRWRATVEACVELLPPMPSNDEAERTRRAGISEADRIANADHIAAAF